MCDQWYGIQSSIFGIRLPNELRQTERININQETHQWNNRGICKLCQGIRKLSFHNLGYFGVVKAWKVLPAIKHKVVRPPAAALILSLLFLAWLLFALCHLFPVSSFVRPPPSPFYPPPPLLIRLGWRPLKNARWGTNLHRQTPICQYLQVSVPCLLFSREWCILDKKPSNILGRANKSKVAANAFVTRIGIRALWLPTRLVITDRPHFVKMSTNLSRLGSNI